MTFCFELNKIACGRTLLAPAEPVLRVEFKNPKRIRERGKLLKFELPPFSSASVLNAAERSTNAADAVLVWLTA